MAVDAWGKTIALADAVLVGGIVRKIAGSEIVIVENGRSVIHAKDVDCLRLASLGLTNFIGQPAMARNDLAAAVTQSKLQVNAAGAHTASLPVLRACRSTQVGITAVQASWAGLPPDPLPQWKAELYKRTAPTSGTNGTLVARTGVIEFDADDNEPRTRVYPWKDPSTGANITVTFGAEDNYYVWMQESTASAMKVLWVVVVEMELLP